MDLGRDDFERLVGEALDELPAELSSLIDNCVILVEDEAPRDEPDLLGLYDGIPLTERGQGYSGVLPDRIFIYRLPTLAICATRDDVLEEVRITVVHEVAHHFGVSDERLHALGYG
jgi:predicted Zn-dependent protease with MMP-like domain